MAASTIPPLSVWPCGTPFGNTQEGPDRLRSAPITDPLSRGFGIPNRSPDLLGTTGSDSRSQKMSSWLSHWYGGGGVLHSNSDKGNLMSRSRSLYCHSDTGPTVLFATEIASEITWLRPEIARVGPEMRNVPTVSFVPNGTFRLSRD